MPAAGPRELGVRDLRERELVGDRGVDGAHAGAGVEDEVLGR